MKKYVAIVATIAIVATGFGIWYSQKDDADSSISQANIQQTPDNTQTNADPSEGGKYLVIKEWNVKVPLSDELIGDIDYKLDTNSSDAITTYFKSSSIVSASNGEVCDIVLQPWGAYTGGLDVYLSRYKTPVHSGNSKFKLVGQYDNHYFYRNIDENPLINCASQISDSLESQVRQATNELTKGIDKLQTI